MFIAVDRTTRQNVRADDAAARRRPGRRYLCPLCEKPVHLRVGRRYSSYFAHKTGVGTEECENYHPAGGYQGGGYGGTIARSRPLSLYIRVADTEIVRSSWRLELLVPSNPDGHGVVSVLSGLGGTISVGCSNIKDAGRRVPIRPGTDPYVLGATNDVDAEYRERISVGAPGLATDVATAFRYSDNGGRRLDSETALYWGRGYYLVWPNSLSPAFPSGVWHEPLRDYGAWQCSRIELPSDKDTEIEHWADDFLNREVERPPVSLSLVAPASAFWVEDDTLACPSDREVIAAVIGERGTRMPTEMRLLESGGRAPQIFALPAENPIIVNFGELPLGVSEIQIPDHGSDDAAEEQHLRVKVLVWRPESGRTPAPMLHFKRGTEIRSLPMHCQEAERMLKEFRRGHWDFTGVALLTRMNARLRTRASNVAPVIKTFTWSEDRHEADGPDYLKHFENDLFQSMREAILSLQEVILDTGNFGVLRLPLESSDPSETQTVGLFPTKTIALSPMILRRVEWLAGIAGVIVARQSVSTCELSSAAETILPFLNDRDSVRLTALRQLDQRIGWPVELLPQVRELSKKLRDLLPRGQ